LVARVVALAASRTVVVADVAVAAAAVHNLRRLVAADRKAVDQTSMSRAVAVAVVGKNQNLNWRHRRRRWRRYHPIAAVAAADTTTARRIAASDVAVAVVAEVKVLRCSNVATEVAAVVAEKHYYTR